MAALPQKAHVLRLRGAGATGEAGQLCGHPDRAGDEHMQTFFSSAPKYTSPARLLDLQVQEMGLDWKKKHKKKSLF